MAQEAESISILRAHQISDEKVHLSAQAEYTCNGNIWCMPVNNHMRRVFLAGKWSIWTEEHGSGCLSRAVNVGFYVRDHGK
eukprot:1144940-Pelagomonas_calceolata.AAC.2